jgi:hypothetical protein
MTDSRDLPICKACRWYDMTQPQCFDGHLQYSGKLECEGFETPLHNALNGSNRRLNTSDDKI